MCAVSRACLRACAHTLARGRRRGVAPGAHVDMPAAKADPHAPRCSVAPLQTLAHARATGRAHARESTTPSNRRMKPPPLPCTPMPRESTTPSNTHAHSFSIAPPLALSPSRLSRSSLAPPSNPHGTRRFSRPGPRRVFSSLSSPRRPEVPSLLSLARASHFARAGARVCD